MVDAISNREATDMKCGTRFSYALAGVCALTSAIFGSPASHAADAAPVKIAVYDFELEDTSAGGGIVPPDDYDTRYLKEATDEAKRWLSESGRYSVVETTGSDEEPVKAHKMRYCSGCIGPITDKLGAEQALIGTITRINRTEYTLQMEFFDARTSASVANYYTNLRMGANYAWPRGVTWLMKNQILAKKESP
jgi:uncharacterized protein DUF2380